MVQRIEPERYAAAVEKQYHALENIYPDKLAAELAANGMTGDVDANRIVGKRINDEYSVLQYAPLIIMSLVVNYLTIKLEIIFNA